MYAVVHSDTQSMYTKDLDAVLWMRDHYGYEVRFYESEEHLLPASSTVLRMPSYQPVCHLVKSFSKSSNLSMLLPRVCDGLICLSSIKTSPTTIPLAILRSTDGELIYKVDKLSTALVRGFVNIPEPGSDEIACVVIIKRIQPNKESCTDTHINFIWNVEEGHARISYKEFYLESQATIVDKLTGCCFSSISSAVLCKETEIDRVYLAPNMTMRTDALMLAIMCDKILGRYFHVSEKTTFSTEIRCRIWMRLPGSATGEGYIARVKNYRLLSLTLSKKLGIKYKTACICFSVNGIKQYHHVYIIERLLNILVSRYKEVEQEYSQLFDSVIGFDEAYVTTKIPQESALKSIRGEVPELFVQRYSRESPILPMVVTDQEAADLMIAGIDVLRYPRDGPLSRWYAPPKDKQTLFVGLKRNRLPNSSSFHLIPTCYYTDHKLRKSSHTYRYVFNISDRPRRTPIRDAHKNKVKRLEEWKRGYIPQYIASVLDYSVRAKSWRVGLPRSVDGFLRYFGIDRHTHTIYPQVSKQELWYMSTDQIEHLWRTCDTYADLLKMYRIIEIALEADIFVITEFDTKACLELCDIVGAHVWRKSYSRSLIIAHTVLNEYEDTYEIVTADGISYIMHDDDALALLASNTKRGVCMYHVSDGVCTIDDIELRDDLLLQYIDDSGKVTGVVTNDGSLIRCYTRPLPIDWMMLEDSYSAIKEYSRVSEHVEQLSRGPRASNIRHIDVKDCFIFVGKNSFISWKGSFLR